MPSRRLAAVLALALALAGSASARPADDPEEKPVTATTLVFTGRGWGHGVGMSQYGALGFARRGAGYGSILAHFYPGTALGPAPARRIRVLVAEDARRVIVGSAAPFSVRDGNGVIRELPAGRYWFGPGLKLRLPGAEPQPLAGPLTFLRGQEPLELDRPYRGSLVVSVAGKRLAVVNVVALEGYVRGVVSREMPQDWPLEAVKAQAVAARSYALAQRRGRGFDVYADTRDQVYGGIAAETPVGEQAVAETRGQVLLYDGKVATTYYFSTSGGRTASLEDVFTNGKPVPYLVSVRDPYDSLSPYHTWGPVAVPAGKAARRLKVPGLSDLRPVPRRGRAREVVAVGRDGEVRLPAWQVRKELGLRSTWFRVGVLVLVRPPGTVAPGTRVRLTGAVTRLQEAALEQRPLGGEWQPGPELELQPDGTFAVAVGPDATTQYRLTAGEVKGGALRVIVGPQA